MNKQEIKVQLIGLSFVSGVIAIGAVVFTIFMFQMSENALMGASNKYKPNYPAVPATDITQAAQCKPGYDKTWVGCQKLGQ